MIAFWGLNWGTVEIEADDGIPNVVELQRSAFFSRHTHSDTVDELEGNLRKWWAEQGRQLTRLPDVEVDHGTVYRFHVS